MTKLEIIVSVAIFIGFITHCKMLLKLFEFKQDLEEFKEDQKLLESQLDTLLKKSIGFEKKVAEIESKLQVRGKLNEFFEEFEAHEKNLKDRLLRRKMHRAANFLIKKIKNWLK